MADARVGPVAVRNQGSPPSPGRLSMARWQLVLGGCQHTPVSRPSRSPMPSA